MLKKKKVVSIILAMILTMGNTATVSAAPSTYADHVEKAVYLMDSQTGEVCEALVKEDIMVEQVGNQYTLSKTTEFYLPNEDSSEISPQASVTDGGVTTRINFQVKYIQSGTHYRLTGVSGSYEQLDSSFTISNRHVKYICQTSYKLGTMEEKDISSNTFSFPGCSHWIETEYGGQWWLGGYAMCKISRGSSSWELKAVEDIITNGNV